MELLDNFWGSAIGFLCLLVIFTVYFLIRDLHDDLSE